MVPLTIKMAIKANSVRQLKSCRNMPQSTRYEGYSVKYEGQTTRWRSAFPLSSNLLPPTSTQVFIFEKKFLPTAEPSVAIVILNWNGKHHLEKFLPSVLTTTYP